MLSANGEVRITHETKKKGERKKKSEKMQMGIWHLPSLQSKRHRKAKGKNKRVEAIPHDQKKGKLVIR
jgi:hypothetical protein